MPVVNYLWNPLNDNIVREFDDAGAVIAEYTTEADAFGNVVSQRRSGQDSVYHYDGQGSTLALTNANGDVTDTFAYNAFGEVTARTGDTVNPFQFIGKKGYYRNAETGEYEVRQRPFSARDGRWLAADPIRPAPFHSSYEYCSNRPLSEVDPSGLWSGSFVIDFADPPKCAGCKGFALRWRYKIPESAQTVPRLLVFQRIISVESWRRCDPCDNPSPCKLVGKTTRCVSDKIEFLGDIKITVFDGKSTGGSAEDNWNWPQAWGKSSPCQSVGSVRVYAMVRAFAYKPDLDPEHAPMTRDKWTPSKVHESECGGVNMGYTLEKEPGWWNEGVLFEGVVEAYQSWNCCASLDDPDRKSVFNVFSTSNGQRKKETPVVNCIDNPDLPPKIT